MQLGQRRVSRQTCGTVVVEARIGRDGGAVCVCVCVCVLRPHITSSHRSEAQCMARAVQLTPSSDVCVVVCGSDDARHGQCLQSAPADGSSKRTPCTPVAPAERFHRLDISGVAPVATLWLTLSPRILGGVRMPDPTRPDEGRWPGLARVRGGAAGGGGVW